MGPSISSGKAPHYRQLMVFVDGTNFLCELAKNINVEFRADNPPSAVFPLARLLINYVSSKHDLTKIRSYWFASYKGNDETYHDLCTHLRENDFEPILFQKLKGKEKGVDIALAMEMLINAFNQNFDVGVMIAGDKDYVGLVKEVKRYGPVINGAFFKHGLSNDLKLTFDSFVYLEKTYQQVQIKPYIDKIRKESIKVP